MTVAVASPDAGVADLATFAADEDEVGTPTPTPIGRIKAKSSSVGLAKNDLSSLSAKLSSPLNPTGLIPSNTGVPMTE
jgi:hypothetical protein